MCSPVIIYVIAEASAKPVEHVSQPATESFFQDVSECISHQRHEDAFDDFQRQPLLPNRLSQLGPGVSWYDLNRDGKEDLIVGAGRGGSLALLLNVGDGRFKLNKLPARDADLTTILGWTSASTWSFRGAIEFRVSYRQPALPVEAQLAPALAVNVADFDGDGNEDVFLSQNFFASPVRPTGRRTFTCIGRVESERCRPFRAEHAK